jgi:serine/threonine-protein kinase
MSVGALAVAISKGELPLPSQSNPSLSPEIDRWFARACAREAMARFPSARAMADALVTAVGGPGIARIRSREAPSMSSLPTTAHIPKTALPSVPPAAPQGVGELPLGTRITSMASRVSRRTWALVGGGALVLGTAAGVVAWQLSHSAPPGEPITPASARAAPETTAVPSTTIDAEVVETASEPEDAAIDAAAKTKATAKPKTKATAAPKKPKPR